MPIPKENPDKERDLEAEFNAKLEAIMQGDDDDEPEAEAELDEEVVEPGLAEQDVDDESADDEEADEEPKPKAKLSKQEAAIVALKREIKELREEKRAKDTAAQVTASREKLVAEFKAQGYDDDTAKFMAEQKLELQQMKREMAAARFLTKNAKLIERFPAAADNAEKIMDVMEKTGFTAEQTCVAMFGTKSNPIRDRAVAAVSGKLESRSGDNALGGATRTQDSASTSTLSAADRRAKARFEQSFPQLGKLSDKRYKELKERYGNF